MQSLLEDSLIDSISNDENGVALNLIDNHEEMLADDNSPMGIKQTPPAKNSVYSSEEDHEIEENEYDEEYEEDEDEYMFSQENERRSNFQNPKLNN